MENGWKNEPLLGCWFCHLYSSQRDPVIALFGLTSLDFSDNG